MIPDDGDAEQPFELRPDGSVGKKSLRLPTLNEVVCSECGAVKEDGSCPACTVTLVPHRTYDEWKVILAAVEAENEILTATVARVKAALTDHAVLSAYPEGQANGYKKIIGDAVLALDSPVELVRAAPVAIEKVKGDTGYTVLTLVEDDGWSEEDRIRLASNDMLLVPLEKP